MPAWDKYHCIRYSVPKLIISTTVNAFVRVQKMDKQSNFGKDRTGGMKLEFFMWLFMLETLEQLTDLI